MNLLFLSHCYPWPLDNGTVQRVYHLLEIFSGKHDVTLVTLFGQRQRSRVAATPLRAMCHRFIEIEADGLFPAPDRYGRWSSLSDRLQTLLRSPRPSVVQALRSPQLVQRLAELREQERFDLVWAERAFFAEAAKTAGFERVVLDLDELESVSFGRLLRHSPRYLSKPLHYAELAKLYTYERALPRRFFRVAVCKEDDRRFFGTNPANVVVVPNGIPVLPCAPTGKEEPGNLLFVGALDYEPNIDAIQHFHEAILPRILEGCPTARFVVVGKNASRYVTALDDQRSCLVESSVPDVTPYFEAASVVVVPMRLGGGTKLKLLEGLARGKAVVSTSVGVQGIDVRPGVDLEVADGPVEFAAGCLRLLDSASERARLGLSGRRRILELYEWSKLADHAERAISLQGDSCKQPQSVVAQSGRA